MGTPIPPEPPVQPGKCPDCIYDMPLELSVSVRIVSVGLCKGKLYQYYPSWYQGYVTCPDTMEYGVDCFFCAGDGSSAYIGIWPPMGEICHSCYGSSAFCGGFSCVTDVGCSYSVG